MTELIQDKLFSKANEAAVLGSMIVGAEIIPAVIDILPNEQFFYLPEHKTIFAAIVKLYTTGRPVDGLTVRTELTERGQLEGIGGLDYLQAVMDSVPSNINAPYYAKIVRERWQYRQQVEAVETIQKALDEPLTITERAEKIQQLALALNANHQQAGCYSFKDNAETVAAGLSETDKNIIPTGYRNIDRLMGGVRPGELVVIAGRPSMGKSALALGVSLSAAKSGYFVLYVSLEMGYKSLIERAVGMIGDINVAAVRQYQQSDIIYSRAKEAALILSKYELVIHEGLNTPEKLTGYITERKKTDLLDLVVVDYLQLMTAKSKSDNRVNEISAISRQLKLLAMQQQIPVIAISQLNRECENRTGHRPRLSDLRDSGSIEQDADIVILLHSEDYYRKLENPNSKDLDGIAEAIVAKNRRGATGTAKLVFLPETVKFGDLTNE